ncbi:hypothetical protein [Periweissella cryptocerci]|uniref:hypothetical protein n=1 Tax=Periweissella cryptocerci TaxID=2506420 RepID=UPI0014044350|nr:hypothetical protein [Periweissella cryptocerci]
MKMNAISRFIIIGAVVTLGNYINSQNLITSALWGFCFVAVVVVLSQLFLKR